MTNHQFAGKRLRTLPKARKIRCDRPVRLFLNTNQGTLCWRSFAVRQDIAQNLSASPMLRQSVHCQGRAFYRRAAWLSCGNCHEWGFVPANRAGGIKFSQNIVRVQRFKCDKNQWSALDDSNQDEELRVWLIWEACRSAGSL